MTNKRKQHIQTDTKHKILFSAAELFARDGYYKVSVREICAAADVSKPVLYYYFNDKEHLLEELINETNYHVEELIAKHIKPGETFENILRAITKLYIEFIDSFPNLLRFSSFLQYSYLPDRIAKFRLKDYKKDMKRMIELFNQAKKQKVISKKLDSYLLTVNFFAGIVMLIEECTVYLDKPKLIPKRLNSYVEFWIEQFLKR